MWESFGGGSEEAGPGGDESGFSERLKCLCWVLSFLSRWTFCGQAVNSVLRFLELDLLHLLTMEAQWVEQVFWVFPSGPSAQLLGL